MKPANVLAVGLLVAFFTVIPAHLSQAGHYRRIVRHNPNTPPAPDISSANSTNAPGPMFPSITSYFPKLPTPAKPPAAVASVVVAPVDPTAEAARKAEIATNAFAWHKQQAEAGSAYAQYQMGMHYLNGDIVPRDLAIAREWFLKSAKQGNDDAYEKLKDLDFPETVHAADGRVLQSSSAHTDFMTQSGHPKGNPGFVIDYKTPITAGGSDAPENMQWVILGDARKAEKWENLSGASTVASAAPKSPAELEAVSAAK